MTSPSALIPLGVVTGAHGVRGELRVKLLNPSSELLASRRQVWFRDAGGQAPRTVELRAIRGLQPGLLLLRIDGCNDRDAANALRGTELCIPRGELPALDSGEYYLVDSIGLQVQLTDGTAVGVVEQTLEYPASQVLRVRTERGALEVPLFEPYLVAIELERRVVVVQNLEDLELEPAPRAKP